MILCKKIEFSCYDLHIFRFNVKITAAQKQFLSICKIWNVTVHNHVIVIRICGNYTNIVSFQKSTYHSSFDKCFPFHLGLWSLAENVC